jgi:hypothetical protein
MRKFALNWLPAIALAAGIGLLATPSDAAAYRGGYGYGYRGFYGYGGYRVGYGYPFVYPRFGFYPGYYGVLPYVPYVYARPVYVAPPVVVVPR